MPRVKRGVTARARHKKILALAKGFRGRRKNVFRIAKQAVMKAGQYAYRDRRTKKRVFRQLWIARINAATRGLGLTYSKFIAGIKKAFTPFLTFGDGPSDALMVNNADWLDGYGYIQFLREFGVPFTINRMLTFEFVKNRLEQEQSLTFLEFNYMLMQAADFLELNKRYGCTLQFGGSEQWGNIVSGIELVRRMAGKEAFGFTAPLVTTASGVKMGKTVDGAVWLNADMRSPYDYWQFWRNTEDADVGRFLKLFTELPMDEVGRLAALAGAEINEAKKILADHATTLLHGADAAAAARGAAEAAFGQGKLSADLPTFNVARGISNTDLMIAAGLATSKGDARRQIAGGAFRVNGEKVLDPNAVADVGGDEFEVRKGNTIKRAVFE